jgi:hypothetical protein
MVWFHHSFPGTFVFCRDQIDHARDLSKNVLSKNPDEMNNRMINHGRDQSGPYRFKEYYLAVQPPSITRVEPVIKAASSEAR